LARDGASFLAQASLPIQFVALSRKPNRLAYDLGIGSNATPPEKKKLVSESLSRLSFVPSPKTVQLPCPKLERRERRERRRRG
jgi:hypothetical protein